MKVRHFLIVIVSILIAIIIGLSFKIGYSAGLSKGESEAEKIRAERLKASQDGKFSAILFGTSQSNTLNVVAAAQFNKIKPITASGFGQVVSSSMINIQSEVQGVINAQINLKKGTKFKKGQLLYTIKNEDVKMALQARKSNYQTLLTNILPDLKLDYANNYDAWLKFFSAIDVTKNLPPLPETKDFKEKNFIVSRNVFSEYYNILSDEERLKKYTVVAPFDGSILNAFTDNGAITSPGSPVISVLREGNLEIEVPISAAEIDLVKNGADVILYDDNGATAKGKVNRKGSYVNPQTQTVPVFIEIGESTINLFNGMYLNADIACEGVEYVVELPRKALFNKNEVYVVRDNRIYAMPVSIKLFQKNTILVKGMADSTVVVLEPVLNAKDSLAVSVLKPSKI